MAAISTKPQKIVCISTGQVYASINEAARENSVQPSSMMRAVKDRRMCCGKYYDYLPAELEGADSAELSRWRMARLLGIIDFCLKG